MPPVHVLILHPEPAAEAGPLTRRLADARHNLAQRHRVTFGAAGADTVDIVTGPPDDTTFGARLRRLIDGIEHDHRQGFGIVVLGSGAVPLLRAEDAVQFVQTAAAPDRAALANNRFSADVVAIARADCLPPIPNLPGDNALPRWLDERAGWRVRDIRRRWTLLVDLDSPLDLVLVGLDSRADLGTGSGEIAAQLTSLRAVAADRRCELVVAGRTSARSLAILERGAACRIRAFVEERGMRASTTLALGADAPDAHAERRNPRAAATRPIRSVLGLLIDRDGPGAIGPLLAELGDAAIVDSRVLLAHRHGVDERGWPPPEDRFASDLLDPTTIADPWLRELTASCVEAPIPILLGGHTLVGPGLPLAVGVTHKR